MVYDKHDIKNSMKWQRENIKKIEEVIETNESYKDNIENSMKWKRENQPSGKREKQFKFVQQKTVEKSENIDSTICLECGEETENYFCRRCHYAYVNFHVKMLKGGDCQDPSCGRRKVDVIKWNNCQHTTCMLCYKNTPHQVKYKVERLKNQNTRCSICAKKRNENSRFIKDGGHQY